jgi:hypothetical protein
VLLSLKAIFDVVSGVLLIQTSIFISYYFKSCLCNYFIKDTQI